MGIVEGSMFYWVLWVFWVFATFLLSKQNPYRTKLAVVILIAIILADCQVSFSFFEVGMSGLFLLLASYSAFYGESRKTIIYFFICSFIMSIAYVTFHLFEIFDPIWLIFNKDWMMGIVFSYVAILLQKSLRGRLLIVISGTMQGEILYAYILNQYDFSYPIGSLSYLDVCSLTSVLLVGWSLLENTGLFFEGYFNLSEKGKQKSS
jgi:hypothetical protein